MSREIQLNTETLTMKRFRLKLSSLLWLVVLAAVFLAGVRYGVYRAEANKQSVVIYTNGGKIVRHVSNVEFNAGLPNPQPEK